MRDSWQWFQHDCDDDDGLWHAGFRLSTWFLNLQNCPSSSVCGIVVQVGLHDPLGSFNLVIAMFNNSVTLLSTKLYHLNNSCTCAWHFVFVCFLFTIILILGSPWSGAERRTGLGSNDGRRARESDSSNAKANQRGTMWSKSVIVHSPFSLINLTNPCAAPRHCLRTSGRAFSASLDARSAALAQELCSRLWSWTSGRA